ncbi:unnamed protein product [Onchocerca ochengi]|uniref:Integrase catalytic domain-containing protein n=1 Tax=Onchocerca ochengi TaxID=42157 RepID=A0A182EQR7_ONCOC|nr:unnamed protein product [Onchocerca ochengi]
MNLNKLASEVKLVLEKAENICAEETQEESSEEKIDRIHLLCEEESRNEGSNVKPSVRENGGRFLTELIEKLVTTSKPPTLSPIEFDGNPRMWGQFISQFEESIHKRTDLTPIQKFMHLLSSLKGEAKEEISDLMTKRQILQFYVAIYDPLGLLGPVILPWKLLIQDLWKKGMSWDEKLEPEEMRRCLELEKAFNQFDVIEVPRWTPQEYSEIHVFVDASEKAVSLAVYARRSGNTPCKPQLIYGKTRLIPKRENRNKSASIPRLELLAVTLGVRALEFIKRETEVEKAYLWTDSACILHWLRKPPVGSRYISNRIDEIRKCKEIEFRHVRSTNNPADQASRGIFPEKLKDNLFWWNGPSWMWEPKENWPENNVTDESIISVCMNMGLMEEEEIQSQKVMVLIDETRFSSLS